VLFYGLADFNLREVVEFYASRADAEADLRRVLANEPVWERILGLVRVDLGKSALSWR
jgi:hypothetical protein